MRKGPRKVIDKELEVLVKFINDNTPFKTLGSCCGHNKYKSTVVVLHPVNKKKYEIFSGKIIPRKKKFYKRDKDGDYYIPEVSNEVSTSLNIK